MTYTWHTNLDTFDKLVFDDLRHNAMLVAMLAYQASEDPQRVPRERAPPTDPRTGRPERRRRAGRRRGAGRRVLAEPVGL